MSKAFVKDDAPTEEVSLQRRDLTEGHENYMTREGYERLKQEALSAEPNRLAVLRAALESAKVIDAREQKSDRALFGATVTVSDEDGQTRAFQIVGVDETDAATGKVSWLSPIAKALLQARVGDDVLLKTPQKTETLEILKIEYI